MRCSNVLGLPGLVIQQKIQSEHRLTKPVFTEKRVKKFRLQSAILSLVGKHELGLW